MKSSSKTNKPLEIEPTREQCHEVYAWLRMDRTRHNRVVAGYNSFHKINLQRRQKFADQWKQISRIIGLAALVVLAASWLLRGTAPVFKRTPEMYAFEVLCVTALIALGVSGVVNSAIERFVYVIVNAANLVHFDSLKSFLYQSNSEGLVRESRRELRWCMRLVKFPAAHPNAGPIAEREKRAKLLHNFLRQIGYVTEPYDLLMEGIKTDTIEEELV